jgi:hypothetical protein
MLGAIAGAAFGTLASAETPEVAFHGFVQAGFASRVNHADETDGPGDVLVAEPRLQLAVTGTVPGADMRLFAKADLFHDAVARKADWELREAYLDLGRRKLSARIGRQIITWGTGDLLFINDIFPKDWGALFAGRPLEYLKVGVDAAKVTLRVEPGALEAVVMPVFEPDRLPSRDRFVLFDPFSGARDHTTEYPRADLDNIELAVRASGSLGGWDAAIYAYRGFYRSPAWIPDIPAAPTRVTERYPRRYVYGASIRGAALGGVVSLEGGYQESPEDRAGFDPFVENSQLLLLAGYQRQLSSSFTIGLQAYAERTMHYDEYLRSIPAGSRPRDEVRQLVTVRVTWLSRYQTWRLSAFAYYSPTDEDYYVITELFHSLADGAWFALGANLFGGRNDSTFFGQLSRNDNVYLTIRYEF